MYDNEFFSKFKPAAIMPLKAMSPFEPNDRNRYWVPVFTFNVIGENDRFYPLKNSFILFEKSGEIYTKIRRCSVGIEVGQPKKDANDTFDAFIRILSEINYSNTCGKLCNVELCTKEGNLVESRDYDGPTIVMAEIEAYGPKKRILLDYLNAKKDNDYFFSLRGIIFEDVKKHGDKKSCEICSVITIDLIEL